MKSGLWQIRLERDEDGKRMPDGAERMKEHMKAMTPEKRQ